MGKKRNIAGFLSGEERQCKIFAVDEGLPFWLVQMLVSLPEQTLTIEKSDDQLQILEEGARERMRVQTATDGETEGIAVICDNPLESLHVQDLLTVAGKKIIDVPESFRFLEKQRQIWTAPFPLSCIRIRKRHVWKIVLSVIQKASRCCLIS